MIEHEFNTENFCLKRPPILMYKILYNACSEQLNSPKTQCRIVQDIFNEHGKRDYFELNPDIEFPTAYNV